MSNRRPPSPHLQALADFFAFSEADAGLCSSFGVLADMARAGFSGGSADRERAYTDWRFGLGPQGDGAVTHARATRSVLLALPSHVVSILWARYGGTPWDRILDQTFGVGAGAKVVRRLGDLAGVALLAPSVARGFAASGGQSGSLRWDNPGGYIYGLCRDEKGRAQAAALRAEAGTMLAEAEALYLAACGAAVAAKPRRQLRPARQGVTV